MIVVLIKLQYQNQTISLKPYLHMKVYISVAGEYSNFL